MLPYEINLKMKNEIHLYPHLLTDPYLINADVILVDAYFEDSETETTTSVRPLAKIGDVVIARDRYSGIIYDCFIESVDEDWVCIKKVRINNIFLENVMSENKRLSKV